MRTAGAPRGWIVGFLYHDGTYWFSDRLLWDATHPPVFLLVAMTAIGAATVVVAWLRPTGRVLGGLLTTAVPLAVALAAGNPMDWPWNLRSGPHLAPASGYWVAVASLVLACVGLLGLIGGLLRRRAQVPRRELASGVGT